MGKPKKHPLVGQPIEVRRVYLLALLSVVSADGELSEKESWAVARVSRKLGCKLEPSHFKVYDLDAIAKAIVAPEVRAAVVADMVKLAGLDSHHPTELAVVKHLASSWGLTPPQIEGVDWAKIEVPSEEERRLWSEKRRETLARETERRTTPIIEGTPTRAWSNENWHDAAGKVTDVVVIAPKRARYVAREFENQATFGFLGGGFLLVLSVAAVGGWIATGLAIGFASLTVLGATVILGGVILVATLRR